MVIKLAFQRSVVAISKVLAIIVTNPWEKIGHRDCSPWAHSELTVSSRWPKWSQPAVTEPWPGPWLSRDWAVIILKMPWLSCDLAMTELWPSCDRSVTSPSRDWTMIIGPQSRDHCGHRELTLSSPWAHGDNFFLMGMSNEFSDAM